jgi:hypothetical protein
MTPALKQVPVQRIPIRSGGRHAGTVKRNGYRLGGGGGCGAMSLVIGTYHGCRITMKRAADSAMLGGGHVHTARPG